MQTLGTDAWVRDANLLSGLKPKADDPAFRQRWREIKQEKKEELAKHIKAGPRGGGGGHFCVCCVVCRVVVVVGCSCKRTPRGSSHQHTMSAPRAVLTHAGHAVLTHAVLLLCALPAGQDWLHRHHQRALRHPGTPTAALGVLPVCPPARCVLRWG